MSQLLASTSVLRPLCHVVSQLCRYDLAIIMPYYGRIQVVGTVELFLLSNYVSNLEVPIHDLGHSLIMRCRSEYAHVICRVIQKCKNGIFEQQRGGEERAAEERRKVD